MSDWRWWVFATLPIIWLLVGFILTPVALWILRRARERSLMPDHVIVEINRQGREKHATRFPEGVIHELVDRHSISPCPSCSQPERPAYHALAPLTYSGAVQQGHDLQELAVRQARRHSGPVGT